MILRFRWFILGSSATFSCFIDTFAGEYRFKMTMLQTFLHHVVLPLVWHKYLLELGLKILLKVGRVYCNYWSTTISESLRHDFLGRRQQVCSSVARQTEGIFFFLQRVYCYPESEQIRISQRFEILKASLVKGSKQFPSKF